MATLALDLDTTDQTRTFRSSEQFQTTVGLGQEAESNRLTTYVNDSWPLIGMAKVPENISDVIVNRLREIAHVKAILMGRSGDVYHIWTMIDEWTVAGRKTVYAAQKELLAKLKGFDLDFYVVAVDEGQSPESLVSDISQVYPLAS